MLSQEPHLSDQELLLAADGELPADQAAQAATHLSVCWSCRARKQEIEGAVVDFVRLHRDTLNPLLPSAAGPRASLKAQLAEMAAVPQRWWIWWPQAAAALFLVAVAAANYHYWIPVSASRLSFRSVPVSFPEQGLTPGAVATVSRQQVCESARPKNRTVPALLQHEVFEEYGIPHAEPRAYEVDYLITPALGGSDDIRNLWPQSYSLAVWNARVKDALEDRLRDLVCNGTLDLVAAQHDISSDWIAAYKKYFHTDMPLEASPAD
jgi:anti-sigma factor RsiW